jgi:hypothetical protein
MAQVVKILPSKWEALSSNSGTRERKRERERGTESQREGQMRKVSGWGP